MSHPKLKDKLYLSVITSFRTVYLKQDLIFERREQCLGMQQEYYTAFIIVLIKTRRIIIFLEY